MMSTTCRLSSSLKFRYATACFVWFFLFVYSCPNASFFQPAVVVERAGAVEVVDATYDHYPVGGGLTCSMTFFSPSFSIHPFFLNSGGAGGVVRQPKRRVQR